MTSSQAPKKSKKIKQTSPSPLSPVTPPETQSFVFLRSDSANKLGKKTQGSLSYQWLCDASHQHLSLQITGNDGAGYFSKEIISFNQIEQSLRSRVEDKPFPSKLFKTSFSGQSSNNSGFLAAILRAEKLLVAAADTETQHLVSGDWNSWEQALLSLPGTAIEIALATAIKKPPETAVPEVTTVRGNSSVDGGSANDENTASDTGAAADLSRQSESDHTDQSKTLKLSKKNRIDLI